MFHIRPFRNEDPPRLLSLWRKCRQQSPRLIPLSMNTLQAQVLGMPFFDRRSIMLAFDSGRSVGYVHTTAGPSLDGSRLDPSKGQICFLCVDPAHPDRWGVANALLKAGEEHLLKQGAKVIYGGSPSLCAPFYIGLHGGGEPIGFFDSDQYLIQTFVSAGYLPHKKTTRFHLNMAEYIPNISSSAVGWNSRLEIEHELPPVSKTWWAACAAANYHWFESIAYLVSPRRPVARLLLRITNPDSDLNSLYIRSWDAGLMYIGVHPDFQNQGLATYLLREVLQRLNIQNRVASVEAQVVSDSPYISLLLRSLRWQEIGTGTLFRKEF